MMLPYLDADALAKALPMTAAIDALEAALVAGLDPTADPMRTSVPTPTGQLLLMPSAAGAAVAVKLVSIAPANPERGLPRIQGVVVLFDPVSLTPLALIDGAALTTLRTPAVSALAVRHVAAADARRLVVFGSGPQADGHIAAMLAVRSIEDVVIVGRDTGKAEALAERWVRPGLAVRAGSAAEVADADLVVCATTAREPLFDGGLVRPGACVVAVGSHEPTARELDTALVQRSRIVVEDVTTALREAGDLMLAGVAASDLVSLGELVVGRIREHAGPTVVKTVGMAWQDAVVAAAAVAR
jgi:ornithine cyclodeaminase/alanine dehydrogenase-like protein (mu-crystallin family)